MASGTNAPPLQTLRFTTQAYDARYSYRNALTDGMKLIFVIEPTKAVPLTCHGHSRPVTHLSFSDIVEDNQYYLISACKGMLPNHQACDQ